MIRFLMQSIIHILASAGIAFSALAVDMHLAYSSFQRGLYLEAFAKALTAASEGNVSAMTMLGTMCAKGIGVPLDLNQAFEWYSKAAIHGDSHAMIALADMIIVGNISKNMRLDTKALPLIESAAALGNPEAQLRLAELILYEEHRPSPRSDTSGLARARSLLESAANKGNVRAQYTYAMLLASTSNDQVPDLQLAAKWLERAATSGLIEAEIEYATWIIIGRGATKNISLGYNIMLRAAYRGHPLAQLRIAQLYASGINDIGLRSDHVEAARWYILAKNHKNTQAEINDVNLELILASLTPLEKTQANLRASYGLFAGQNPLGRFVLQEMPTQAHDSSGVLQVFVNNKNS